MGVCEEPVSSLARKGAQGRTGCKRIERGKTGVSIRVDEHISTMSRMENIMTQMNPRASVSMRMRVAGVVLSIGLVCVGAVEATSSTDEWLITPQEAALAPRAEAPGGTLLDVGKQESNLGPTIEILKPDAGGKGEGPVEIQINFVPKTGAVDVSSLKVTVVKLFPFDITDRLRDYATAEGIQIKGAKIPAGKHIVRISVADTQGARSIKEIEFEVL